MAMFIPVIFTAQGSKEGGLDGWVDKVQDFDTTDCGLHLHPSLGLGYKNLCYDEGIWCMLQVSISFFSI